jgi:hypothetical protein
MMRAVPLVRAGWLLFLSACATLADSGGGDEALPNAAAGPFRPVTGSELGENRVAPYVLDDDDTLQRDVSVIDADGDPATAEAWVYAAANEAVEGVEPDPATPSRILRFVAADGRSPKRIGDEVLVAEEPWEGTVVGAPSALRVNAEIWLFYAAEGGIGLAKSVDGVSFVRSGPVLEPTKQGWEGGAVPRSPAAVRVADGTLHLFYEVTVAGAAMIGEASSIDGVTFVRAEAPAIAPRAGAIDAAGARGPCAVLARSAEGRTIEYLYYGADDGSRKTIALAARYDAQGAFAHAEAPVFGNDRGPGEPWVVRHEGYSLLFVTQRASGTSTHPAVALGVAPADITLP